MSRRDAGCERGALAVWAALVIPAFLLLVGLGVDLAGHAAAQQDARAVAAEAARSGGQYLTITPGLRATPDAARAKRAAEAYVASSAYTGSASIEADGRIVVQVNGAYDTVFLGIIGVDQLPVEGTAAARSTSVLDGQES